MDHVQLNMSHHKLQVELTHVPICVELMSILLMLG